MASFPITERTRVRRLPARGAYDRETVYSILDAGLVCHVSFVDEGRPVAIPTAYARIGDAVVIHGSAKSRMLVALAAGADACVTVTHLDGLVLARSAFHHSVNYRSVVVFGRAVEIADAAEKHAALESFLEHVHPGRWAEVRRPSAQELIANEGRPHPARRGQREGPDRRSDRRRREPDARGLGWRRTDEPHPRRPDPRRLIPRSG